jgi:V/A-type H+-transporting ATPase subunit E
MSDDLKNLLDKIEKEGVAKAEEEKKRLVAEAKEEAKRVVAEAEKKAASIVKKAEEEAKFNQERGEAAIKQAARDVGLALEAELKDRLRRVAKECADEAMTPDLMGKLVLEMQRRHLEKSGNCELETILNEKDLENMKELFLGSLKQDLKSEPELSLGHDFGAGIKIGFKGDDVFLDFSDEALTDLICDYVGPKLTEIIRGGK